MEYCTAFLSLRYVHVFMLWTMFCVGNVLWQLLALKGILQEGSYSFYPSYGQGLG
jgi:hypothetical protein